MVIPNDWKEFISAERMTTRVNTDARQDARGREMMLDFRQLVIRVLDSTEHPEKFLYKSSETPLIVGGVIPRGAALMSGTSEGVIFTPPTTCDIFAGVGSAIIKGQITSRRAVVSAVKEHFLRSEMKSGRFLQVGDVIEHQSSSMGDIRVEVTTPMLTNTADNPVHAQHFLK
jgi:2-keto-4-pentenoate hydratase/2-oxohepta-3-ene-1,7-dioic acid hydratase in catechol pathway